MRNNNKISGFSLIELSIVLIIIGLLVAGVTGGSSLIESARVRAFVNEVNGYKQAINTYYVAKGKLPGDESNMGCFNIHYNNNECGYSFHKAFEDLYKEGITDFDAEECNNTNGEECNNINVPTSKVFKNGFFNYLTESGNVSYYSAKIKDGDYLSFDTNYKDLDVKIMKRVDEIMDDGVAYKGNVISLISDEEENNNEQFEQDIEYEDGVVGGEMLFKLDI